MRISHTPTLCLRVAQFAAMQVIQQQPALVSQRDAVPLAGFADDDRVGVSLSQDVACALDVAASSSTAPTTAMRSLPAGISRAARVPAATNVLNGPLASTAPRPYRRPLPGESRSGPTRCRYAEEQNFPLPGAKDAYGIPCVIDAGIEAPLGHLVDQIFNRRPFHCRGAVLA